MKPDTVTGERKPQEQNTYHLSNAQIDRAANQARGMRRHNRSSVVVARALSRARSYKCRCNPYIRGAPSVRP